MVGGHFAAALAAVGATQVGIYRVSPESVHARAEWAPHLNLFDAPTADVLLLLLLPIASCSDS